MLRTLILFTCITYTLAVRCYDCYDTGPDHTTCTEDRSCEGLACMIFDAGDNATATAFCLLAMRGGESITQKSGCWLEPDGRGRHCMCHEDFCNRLVPRGKQSPTDPMVPLLPNAEFLKQNPLLDYHDHLGDSSEDGAAPRPENILFPSAVAKDPKVAGGSDDDDLVPVDFADYDRELSAKEPKSQTPSSVSVHPPAWMLMTMTLATSLARLFA
ncbi:unnamed protein product [Cylicocyclus nassatus]|uniref:Uncharacterized protein n=1 Tax=Cylicocyclus nassatus TaxID=53992 RepID=A0AA36DSY7_CYLNA|nr:unnamed protein product [Cylicocyclus nassatus]